MTPIMAQGGAILARPTGGILATDCGSTQLYQLMPCTCDPCDVCLSTNQNIASVTTSGSCGYGCDTAVGSYVPVSATGYDASCIWQYDGPLVGLPGGRWGLTIRYERGPGVWAAGVDCPPGGAYFMYYGYGITGIYCGIDGKLAGSFTVPGIGALLADCTGCSASVNLGGCSAGVNLGGGTAGDCSDRCPGGAPLFTATNLAAYVGKTIEIAEDPDICYAVSEYFGTPDTLVAVTPSKVFDNCNDCCGDTGGTTL